MLRTLRIRISGKVQGVYFRKSAKETADSLGIKGFVCNESDGSVCAEVEGEEEPLNKFIAWCRPGPPRATVTNVEINEVPLKNFSEFSIQR